MNSTSRYSKQPQARRGLTLLELVVVLVIMSALAGVAIRMTGRVADQSRYEATQRTLEEVRDAIVGPTVAPTTEASAAVASFVADVGRPPTGLDELLANVNNLPLFEVIPAADTGQPHADVLVPRGWRGPYVRLPVGAATIRDGWGRDLVTTVDGSTSLLTQMASLGADGLLDTVGGTSDYNRDSIVEFPPAAYRGVMITGKVYKLVSGERMPPTGGVLTITLFSPDPSGAAPRGVLSVPATLTVDAMTSDVTFRIETPTVGPRILRAAIDGVPVGSPKYVVVRPGETIVVDLRVQ